MRRVTLVMRVSMSATAPRSPAAAIVAPPGDTASAITGVGCAWISTRTMPSGPASITRPSPAPIAIPPSSRAAMVARGVGKRTTTGGAALPSSGHIRRVPS